MKLPEGVRGLGIPFYSEAEWHKAKTVMADGQTFHATYAQFVGVVDQRMAQLRRQGTPTVKVYLRVDDFVAWCHAGGRQVNAEARAEYAAIKAREQDNG